MTAQSNEAPSHYLNIGCGSRYSRDNVWTNIDMAPRGEGVLRVDIQHGIPFPDAQFSLVYHSHVLEHFDPPAAVEFIRECYRVLKPGGILRVAVPDLERLARDYLKALDSAIENPTSTPVEYDWTVLALLDQSVREKTCGMMADYLSTATGEQLRFASEMIGVEADETIASVKRTREAEEKAKVSPSKKTGWLSFLFRPGGRRDAICRLLLGDEYELLQKGRFRASGEIHKWMYDRFSLARLLGSVGFQEFTICEAGKGGISEWGAYGLEINGAGRIFKPDSLFAEARKPL